MSNRTSTRDPLLLWLDFESTGLDPNSDDPIEVAVILTDAEHQPIARYESVIVPREEALYRLILSPVVLEMHRANGLLDEVVAGKVTGTAKSLTQVEEDLLALLAEHSPTQEVTLSGSGVGHYDLPVILSRMPMLAECLTYFVNDVGTLRRAYIRSNGRPLTNANASKTHRAMDDIECHLAEGRAFHELMRMVAR